MKLPRSITLRQKLPWPSSIPFIAIILVSSGILALTQQSDNPSDDVLASEPPVAPQRPLRLIPETGEVVDDFGTTLGIEDLNTPEEKEKRRLAIHAIMNPLPLPKYTFPKPPEETSPEERTWIAIEHPEYYNTHFAPPKSKEQIEAEISAIKSVQALPIEVAQ